jgi:Transcription initiation factor TFIID 23-30kDa subunit
MQSDDADGLPSLHRLPELMDEVSAAEPSIPDALTRYLARASGAEFRDERALRLISLVANRFMLELLSDVRAVSEQRTQGNALKGKEKKWQRGQRDDGATLTSEALAAVCEGSDIFLSQQMYYPNGDAVPAAAAPAGASEATIPAAGANSHDADAAAAAAAAAAVANDGAAAAAPDAFTARPPPQAAAHAAAPGVQ